MKWMNLPDEYSTDESKYVIIPIAYEKALTYGDGTSLGPAEIINASKHLEYYEDQFDCEPFLQGIRQLDIYELSDLEPKEMVKRIRGRVAGERGKFIIGLGGDHAVTNGIVQGLEEQYEEFSVIQFDAHADFRDSWNGSPLNHACVTKQISKKHDILLIGIRSLDIDEKKEIDRSEHVHLISAYDFSLEKVREMLLRLKKNVFITIDVDGFDSTFIRNTGTPEPGGLLWNDVINSLKIIFEEKNVIGADVVEFAPKENFDSEAYALAKLVYKIMAMKETYKNS